MPKRPRLGAARPGRVGLDEVAAREREERRTDVASGEDAHDVGLERLAADRSCLDDAPLVGAQPVETGGEQRVDRVRHRGATVLERGGQQLLEEQRVPGRGVEDRRPSFGRERDVGREPVDERLRVAGRQSVQQDRRRVEAPARPLGPRVEQLGPREREHEDRRARERGDVLDEVEERRRSPVQVLEHEHDRPLARERLEQAPDGPRGLLHGACRRRLARGGRDPRRDGVPVGLARDDVRGPRCDAPAGGGRERVPERRERRRLERRRPAHEARCRGVEPAGELAREPRLAHPRRPEESHQPRAAVPDDARECRLELSQLVLATDERALEPPHDRFDVVAHLEDGVRAVARVGDDGVPDEPPRAPADEDVAFRRGGAKPVGLLERLSRHERLPAGGIARDHVARRESRPGNEAGGSERAGDVHRAQRVVLVRARDAEDREHAVVGGASGGAALRAEHSLGLCAAPAQPLAPRFWIAGSPGGDVCEVCEEHRHRLPGLLHRARGPRGRRVGRRGRERGILAQDRALERLEPLARLGADLLDERRAGSGVGVERVGLAAGAVEREHELRTEPLAQRVLAR